jgi:hypothetical protein
MRCIARFLGVAALAAVFLAGCGGEDARGVICEAFCAKDAECFAPEDQTPRCTEACAYTLNVSADFSAECGGAAADLFACVADLPSCEQVDAYWFEIPADSYPCKAGDDQVESACF